MSIYGIGIDLCEIVRVEQSLAKHGAAFAEKILNQQEIKDFNSHRFQSKFLAKKFAAKEAFSKAFGTGIADSVTFPDIEVYHNEMGKPFIRLHGKTSDKVQQLGDTKIHLTISDEKHYAVAQVIIENI
jgi:holo-[acyl-carrier protein] synthase